LADVTVSLCKFHRLQAWNRRLTRNENKDVIIQRYVPVWNL